MLLGEVEDIKALGVYYYIFVLWFLPSIFLFFPRLISVVADWMPTILPHMVWP